MVVLGDAHPVVLVPGQTLQSSTAIGIFMQPAVLILGLLLAWPVRSMREACVRGSVGAVLLALWLLAGIPLSLWILLPDCALAGVRGSRVVLVGGRRKISAQRR